MSDETVLMAQVLTLIYHYISISSQSRDALAGVAQMVEEAHKSEGGGSISSQG